YILALLSKSACVTLSATIIISDRLVLRRWSWQSFARVIPMVLLGLVAARATSYHEHQNRKNKAGVVFLDLELRPLAAAGATWFYVGKVVWPVGFPGVYPRWEILKNWPIFIAALFALPVLGFALWKLRRKIAPPALWGVAHYILCLSPMLGLIPFNYTQFTFVADHFVYLPIIGVFLCLALLGEAARRRFRPGWVGAVPMTTLAVAVLIALGVLSFRHNTVVWKDGKSFWECTVKLNKLCWPAQFNLANIYSREGHALRKKAREARSAQDEVAAAKYDADARIKAEAAAEHYEWATVANPNLIPVEKAASNAFYTLRQYDKAAHHMQRAIDILTREIMTREGKRGYAWYQYRLRLSQLLMRAKKPEEAEKPLRDLVAAEPATVNPQQKTGAVLVQARLRLARLLMGRKEYGEAIEHYERLLEIDPNHTEARRNLEVAKRARDQDASAESRP
ncbi:MAG: tetratricopeptide repeat protein, partial [bacterium]|nr:tetratricopeptide repeat protein [bacterium]